jgi:putative Mg2+ transporter-C (MgtC) family protein
LNDNEVAWAGGDRCETTSPSRQQARDRRKQPRQPRRPIERAEGNMNLDIATWDVLRLPLAALLGGLIGWERERGGKPAGLRTNMMVALGASAFTLVSSQLVSVQSAGDPTRIVTGVATGIGFLGAGSIIRSRGEVEGMTTAAGIWVVGAIGAACGLGAYLVATVAAVLALAILVLLLRVERKAGFWRGKP